MTITNKILPTIALGLASMLSVCNAGEATWDGNRLEFNPNSDSTTSLSDKVFSNLNNGNKAEILIGSYKATYNGNITLDNSDLSLTFFNQDSQFIMNGNLTLNSNSSVSNDDFYVGDFSYLGGTVVLNGGEFNVSISNSNTSTFAPSSTTFNGGNAVFSFDNSSISGFGAKVSNGIPSTLIFDESTPNGKSIFNFNDSNRISFKFEETQLRTIQSKAQEDVLLNFNGNDNVVSFYDFTNMKIVFGKNSSNNIFKRTPDDKVKNPSVVIENQGINNSIFIFTDSPSNTTPYVVKEIVSGSKSINFISEIDLRISTPIFAKLIIKQGSGSHNLGIRLSYAEEFTPTSELLVASAVKTITLNPIDGYINGFVLSKVEYAKKITDESGSVNESGDYISYYIKSAKNVGVAPVNQSITSSALALNYDLFIGNFNSLNKRMGELRDDPYSQGAWARVFNGQISNDFSGSKNNYTTIQMGYDHKLGEFENASNYLGASVSYLLGLSDQHSIDSSSAYLSRSIKDVISNGVEIALYNSYVQDEGWFSDSIAKFSYLASDFNILDNTNNTSEKQSTSNIAFTLSEEFGYRFKLGESKAWYLDPQVEMALGYFSGTDLKQVAGNDYLDAKSDSMLMFRARVGTAVGYDFKDFTADKDFNAKLYVGLSYEADFVSGGDVTLTPNNGSAMSVSSVFSSDGRGVLNVGTNVKIKEQTRVYADIQTSFGGKITNDYQVNFGVRYSFGESASKEALKTKQD